MDVVDLYLAGTATIRAAITDPAVVEAWEAPSVLEAQTVGSLAGHLARTGSWIVDEFLGAGAPDRPVDFATVAEFYVALLPTTTPTDDDPVHQGIRDRGAALAAEGPATLAARIEERMPGIEAQLRRLLAEHRLVVTGGNVMALDQYLVTRVVEQVVHLDDLARSIGHEPWPVPDAAHRLVAEVAVDVALRRHDPHLVVRGLYRRGHADAVFPVL